MRDALGKYNAVPTIDFGSTFDADIPTFVGGEGQVAEPRPTVNPHYNPFDTDDFRPSFKKQDVVGWQDLYAPVAGASARQTELEDMETESVVHAQPVDIEVERTVRPLLQQSRYIVTSAKSGLMVIDSVRAHVRILYDRVLRSMLSGESLSQPLLFPELVQLGASQSYVLDGMLCQLNAAGFDIAPSGNATYAVSAVPAVAAGADCAALITQLVDDESQSLGSQNAEASQPDSFHHALALTIARTNAMRSDSRRLDAQEMAALIDDLFACELPNFTPDGKAIISIIATDDIAKLFR